MDLSGTSLSALLGMIAKGNEAEGVKKGWQEAADFLLSQAGEEFIKGNDTTAKRLREQYQEFRAVIIENKNSDELRNASYRAMDEIALRLSEEI